MTSNQPEAASTRPLPSPDRSPTRATEAAPFGHNRPKPRDVVRLFQCRLCSLPLSDPTTLPCGESVCKRCLPETYARVNITYPAVPDRLQGFQCPFKDCGKEHAVGDCEADVILNKATIHIRHGIAKGRDLALELKLESRIEVRNEDETEEFDMDKGGSQVLVGGTLVATWTLAEKGALSFDSEVILRERSPFADERYDSEESEVFREAQDATRAEMDCQICYGLFDDPLTTSCGHTFCRTCLHRILDYSTLCPVCRRKLAMNPLLNRIACPSNKRLKGIINAFWKDELQARRETLSAETLGRDQEFDIPLFVCTLSFPLMPTFLHIFEPRYRLMIRRALEGDHTFGMVLPRRPRHAGDPYFHELGTLLRITNVQFYPDGRSLIETMGVGRFKILAAGDIDGYAAAKIERIDDMSLEEEEAMEAAEAVAPAPPSRTTSHSNSPASSIRSKSRSPSNTTDLDSMSTAGLMEFAMAFVTRMRSESVPWLTERMLTIYGECPDDPAVFPWWFASMLPVRDIEKYRLLGTSSVRDRLKLCCFWIIEWQTSNWSPRNCVIL